MFLQLGHTNLPIYSQKRNLVFQIYKATAVFPPTEKYCLVQQLRRASVSVHLNVAEGCSRKSMAERKRYYEVARGSLIEIDTGIDISLELNYLDNYDLKALETILVSRYKQRSGMIKR